MYISSTLGRLHVPDRVDFYKFVFKNCDHYANRIALIDDDKSNNQFLTYGQLHDYIRCCSFALNRSGLRKGEIVVIISPNCLEYVVAFFAVLAAGGVITTCNPDYTTEEMKRQLDDCKPMYLMVHEKCADTVKMTNYHFRKKIIFGRTVDTGYQSIDDLMKGNSNYALTQLKINPKSDVAVILYSSGTTGLPKGVMLSHYNLVADMVNFGHPTIGATDMNYEDECFLNVLPLFHVYGLISILSFTLCSGRRLVIQSKFKPEKFLNAIQKYKVTKILVVPPIVIFLAKSPLVDNYDLSSLTYVSNGAAPVGGEIGELVERRLKLETFNQGYGMTELGPLVVFAFRYSYKPGSVGKLVPNTDCKVIDIDTGRSLGVNKVGELCFRGPQMMLGYLNNPEATAKTIDKESWLHTGDIGFYDEEGNVFIVDRLKELIKHRGYQVAPAELEAVLIKHPRIKDVAVIGIPDYMTGELPKALVVLKNSEDPLTGEEIASYLASKVAWYKHLRGGVEFVQSIPKSSSGKILRRLIKGRYSQQNSKL